MTYEGLMHSPAADRFSNAVASASERRHLEDAAPGPPLPCPMCDKPDAEGLSNGPTMFLYVCLMCGYRFAMARPRQG